MRNEKNFPHEGAEGAKFVPQRSYFSKIPSFESWQNSEFSARNLALGIIWLNEHALTRRKKQVYVPVRARMIFFRYRSFKIKILKWGARISRKP